MFKFRGKRLDNGKWVYGDKVAIRNSKGVETIGIKDTIYHVNDGYCNIIPDEIDPSTLGVSWGMKDKDVDVFTGDTLEDCCGYKGVVVFSIERSEFCLQVGDNLHPIIQGDYYKLIGNIHENPEIIEEE